MVGKPNYGIRVSGNAYTTLYTVPGYNLSMVPDFGLYIPASETGILGVEPIDNYTFSIDMSNMPEGWYVYECKRTPNSLSLGVYGDTINDVVGARPRCTKNKRPIL